jgi:putative flavoprotein involved in K+ transport
VIVVGGGQSGLAAARVLREFRVPTVILEAGDRPAGSWPHYYDSLESFSPVGYSSLPGMPFPGEPDHYPSRDEVAGYLERYAATLDVEIQTDTRVATIHQDGRAFLVFTEDGRELSASGIVAASGSFSNPHRPSLPGEETFTGRVVHVADYRNPTPFEGQRVVVVGAGDSAAQVANELARVATTSIATRHPIRFIPQRIGGHDVHYWFRETGFDTLPPAWLGISPMAAWLPTASAFARRSRTAVSIDVRFSSRSTESRWSGATANPNRSMRSSSPRDTYPACTT